jgi:RNA polymerase sigma-70 factor, ECF subfamily
MTLANDEQADVSDSELLMQMDKGDQRALEALYDRYSRVVFSFALRMVGDRAVAEELLQEVFFRTWQQAARFSERRGSCITWMLSITHNLAIDEIRKRNRRPQRADSADPVLLLTNVVDGGPTTEEHALFADLQQQIRNALESLPHFQRTPIEMAYFQGLTQREIAEQLGEPLGTVKTRIRLGVRKLQEYLERNEVGLA